MTPDTEHEDRYDYVVDPCNLYVVWDRMADLPAASPGGILAFATVKEAIAAVHRLNRRQCPESQNRPVAVKKSLRRMIGEGGTDDAGQG